MSRVVFKAMVFVFALAMLSTTGCYERTIAPELTYDDADVERLKGEVEKIDWDY